MILRRALCIESNLLISSYQFHQYQGKCGGLWFNANKEGESGTVPEGAEGGDILAAVPG
jgi:hypothetical protein